MLNYAHLHVLLDVWASMNGGGYTRATCLQVYIVIHIHMHIHIYIRLNMDIDNNKTHIRINTSIYIYTYTHAHMNTYTSIRMHMYISLYIYTDDVHAHVCTQILDYSCLFANNHLILAWKSKYQLWHSCCLIFNSHASTCSINFHPLPRCVNFLYVHLRSNL